MEQFDWVREARLAEFAAGLRLCAENIEAKGGIEFRPEANGLRRYAEELDRTVARAQAAATSNGNGHHGASVAPQLAVAG